MIGAWNILARHRDWHFTLSPVRAVRNLRGPGEPRGDVGDRLDLRERADRAHRPVPAPGDGRLCARRAHRTARALLDPTGRADRPGLGAVPRPRSSTRRALDVSLRSPSVSACSAESSTPSRAPGSATCSRAARCAIPFALAVPMAVNLAAILASQLTGFACLTAFGLTRALATSTIVGAVVGTALMLPLLLWIGAPGVAWGLAAAELCVLAVQLVTLAPKLRRREHSRLVVASRGPDAIHRSPTEQFSVSLTWNEIQRVVFPQDADPDVISLYVDADVWAKVGDREVRVSDRAHLDDVVARDRLPHRRGRARLVRELLQRVPGLVLAAVDQRRTRPPHRSRRAARARCSSTVRPRRACRSVWHPSRSPTPWCTRSSSRSRRSATAAGTGSRSSPDDSEVVVGGGSWKTDAPQLRSGGASIGITTFNKPDYCVRTLDALAADATVRDVIDRVYLSTRARRRSATRPVRRGRRRARRRPDA